MKVREINKSLLYAGVRLRPRGNMAAGDREGLWAGAFPADGTGGRHTRGKDARRAPHHQPNGGRVLLEGVQ